MYHLITTQGTSAQGGYAYQELRAGQDFDGYSCWISYQDLTITLLFHGTYHVDYKEQDTLSLFLKKIAALVID